LEKNPGRISLRCAMFIPVSPGEMTSGTQMSVAGERERGYHFGRKGKWATATSAVALDVAPEAFSSFSLSFPFYFLVLLDFLI
jgi:hypothetical protein